ncbi:hypothetical protein BKH24_05830 [Actinomyces oris]|nr:hypothetical protein BKH24_05830 [Actinomyces oris]DAN82991.1 MAG TPA: head closure knob [Caudoviricetes sp.]
MDFPSRFIRRRPRKVPDPVNPRRMIESWDTTDDIELHGFLDSQDSDEDPGPVRSEVSTTATLYVEDTTLDVARGDLITDGVHSWRVDGFPATPKNPFTGWQPYLVIRLKEVRG